MKPNLENLKKAIESLEYSLSLPKDDIVRDSVIQRFEYTFELTWKTLKKFLLWTLKKDEYYPKNIFRECARINLIDSVEDWFVFLEARNLTSHTYSQITAEKVYEAAKKFLPKCKQLLINLESNLEDKI